MPLPPPLAAAAEEEEEEEYEEREEERPWPPPMKMKLAPYAMYCVFEGMGPRGVAAAGAYTGMHFAMFFVRLLSLSPVGPRWAGFFGALHGVIQTLCFAATALIACVFIRWYMAADGVYEVKYDPPEQPAAAAAVTVVERLQLPPPPPEMDMC